jgi:predicted Fe-Mo cluster-binding NifX family protein
MKIAVPTKGNEVDDHFGHCEAFTVFSVDENNNITASEIVPSLQGCGCKSNIAAVLQEKGVNIMLSGNMGNGAVNVLHYHGIQVYRGCTGDVHQVTTNFLKGKISDSGESCNHHRHGEGHQCDH